MFNLESGINSLLCILFEASCYKPKGTGMIRISSQYLAAVLRPTIATWCKCCLEQS